jgi:preprotein translocase subunit SecD
MRLDKDGTGKWSIATQNSIGLKLAFVLDNRLLQVATVMSQITGGVTAINRSIYSKQDLENFKKIIENER